MPPRPFQLLMPGMYALARYWRTVDSGVAVLSTVRKWLPMSSKPVGPIVSWLMKLLVMRPAVVGAETKLTVALLLIVTAPPTVSGPVMPVPAAPRLSGPPLAVRVGRVIG